MLMIFFLYIFGVVFVLHSYYFLLDIIDYVFSWDIFNAINEEPILKLDLDSFLEPILEPIFENDQQKIIQILEEKIKILEKKIKIVEEENKALIRKNWALEKKNTIKYIDSSSFANSNNIIKKWLILLFFSKCLKKIIYIIDAE